MRRPTNLHIRTQVSFEEEYAQYHHYLVAKETSSHRLVEIVLAGKELAWQLQAISTDNDRTQPVVRRLFSI